MAFQLRPNESVTRGLRRVAKQELLSAHQELRKHSPPPEEAIHEARKSVKKVRAVLRLMEEDAGRPLGKCQKRLRRINRALSPVRDADVMLESLAKLKQKHPNAFSPPTFARMRRRLSANKRAALKAAHKNGAWKKVDRALRTVQDDAKRWRPKHRGFAAVERGIQSTYRSGRQALARALKTQRAADFHEWRKHIKALWYQLRLVEGSDRGMKKDVRALHRAETALGDDHNAVVLCAELSKGTSLCDLESLRRVANRYQCNLRRHALATTRAVYAPKPKRYVRRLRRAWRVWRRGSDSRRRTTA
jgi:CHAD domain-containing protein